MNPPQETKGKDKRKRYKGKNVDENGNKLQNKITKCSHVNEKYYAMGMCRNCYNKNGRVKRAPCHPDKPFYSKDFCQNCYMKEYSKNKRRIAREAKNSLQEQISESNKT